MDHTPISMEVWTITMGALPWERSCNASAPVRDWAGLGPAHQRPVYIPIA